LAIWLTYIFHHQEDRCAVAHRPPWGTSFSESFSHTRLPGEFNGLFD
jgi:hypothetical protein